MAASPFAHGREAIAWWVSEDSSDFIFLFISNRSCSPWGVGTRGMKLWAGKLIMPPCMVELVNTKLSLRLILPWGRRASQIPFLFLFAWGEEAFGVLPVWENRSKIQEASWSSEMVLWVLVPNMTFWYPAALSPPAQMAYWGLESDKLSRILVLPLTGVMLPEDWKQTACPLPPPLPSSVGSAMCHWGGKPASLYWSSCTECLAWCHQWRPHMRMDNRIQ